MTKMVRNGLPLMETVMIALTPWPGAYEAVQAACAKPPKAETADVHPDEVENWAAHGWKLADQDVNK